MGNCEFGKKVAKSEHQQAQVETLQSSNAQPLLRQSDFMAAFLRARPMLHRCAMKVLRNQADAEDAVQEAALLAWRKRDTVRDERYVATWLYRITFNTAIDGLRKRRSGEGLANENIAAPHPNPEQLVCAAELDARLRSMIRSMPASYGAPLSLRISENGLSYEEVGLRLGISPQYAKLRVCRAKMLLTKAARES